HYKRFIELIWERGVEDAFQGKYAATLSTSIHFFDHTAHNYVHAICDDLGMRFVASFSPEMRDLLTPEGQVQLTHFGRDFVDAIEHRRPMPRLYAPVVARALDYRPGEAGTALPVGDRRVVIVTDTRIGEDNVARMVERFRASLAGPVEVVNLHDVDIKSSCLGCLKCGYDNECAFTGKDGFIDFYDTVLKPADVLVFAGAIHDRYLSSRWKAFFDRSFFNTHTPSLVGKQFAFLISGPLGQNANLREILAGWVELQRAHLAGFVTDEYGDSAEIDALLHDLARRVLVFAAAGYVPPQTFLGVGGMKIFRDDIWGRLRTVFQADHRAYKEMGIYDDFPQRDLGVRALNAVTGVLFRVPRVRREFAARIKEQMIQPYARVLED
ncbi:MAG: hypothetical protein PVG11_03320, partial [Anaerolineae bacterium]